MTQVRQPRGVDSDRVDGGRRPWRPMLACLVIGLVAGGGLGYAYGDSKATSYVAKVALSVQPDSSVVTPQGQNAPTVDATSFVQSQLVILNGNQLAAQVQRALKLPSAPSVSSTQVGQSYVVQVSASAASKASALSVATSTSTLYIKQRVSQLTASINQSVASTTAEIKTVQANLVVAQAGATPLTGVTPSETALQTEYERLLQLNSTLATAKTQVGQVATVLSPASIATGSLSPATKDAVGGALLGAMLGLALLIVGRRALPRIRTVGDLASLEVPVLLPVLPRRSRRRSYGRRAWRSSAGRLLAARLTSHRAMPSGPIVVVGASARVGTSFVAATLASGLSERGPVLLVLASEALNGSRGRQLRTASTRTGRGPATEHYETGDLLQRAVPSTLPGVWLLPWDREYPELKHAVPSVRSALLKDVLQRAVAAEWLVVVDAPALSDSDLALDCVATHGTAALVVGRGKSRPADVLSAADLFEAHGSHLEGVILNDVPRSFLPRRRGRTEQSYSISPTSPDANSGYTPTRSAPGSAGEFLPAAASPYETSPLRLDLASLSSVEPQVSPTFEPRAGGGHRRAPVTGLRHGARGSR